MVNPDFWRGRSLEEFSPEEWEALCDGCARCCLHKHFDPDGAGRVRYTGVACRVLDLTSCRCTDYQNRVPGCVTLTPEWVRGHLGWMPETCAYRLIAQGDALPDWHPLVSGRPESVHEAGISIRSWALGEDAVADCEEYPIRWVQ
ncbi:MAG: YcgN family cysteine cluster protein [Gammaproteobacteria bacterium AqS3]|nr:YcgN family cysteine cluster protein [Gammaproteobacteria bacterium AqS3]